jgi:hypothetical protein
MKTDSRSILLVTGLIIFLLVVCVGDRFFYQENKKTIESFNTNIIENFDNHGYSKFSETVVPNSFLQSKEKGNLDQCKKNCDDDADCIGFTRENLDDDSNGECNLIYKMDHCLNENKKPSENITLPPNTSDDFQKYNTYLKNQDIDKYNLTRMNCIILNELVSIKHNKYPFDFVYQNNNGNLIMNKVEVPSEDVEKVKTVFKLVKGLSGKGVSFSVMKGQSEYYLVNHNASEDIKLEQSQEGGQFKKDATFEIDIQHDNKSNLFSIRKAEGNRDLYWKINQTNKRVVMTNINDVSSDKKAILFEIVHPMIDTFNAVPLEAPAPTVEEDPEPTEDELKDEKQTELEKLELEIREVQHQQNMKLMNIMLNVNKFKLMDLSMSDYLTKCNQSSSEELIRVVPVESAN